MIVTPMSRLDALRLRQQAIGVRLRQEFDAIVLAPVPQEWLELLRRADALKIERPAAEARS